MEEKVVRKSKKRLNINRRNFLTGSVTLAGAAAAATVVPISFAKANHSDSDFKGLPDFIKWKNRDALIVHSKKGIEAHRSAIGESIVTPIRNIYIRNNMPTMTDEQIGDRSKWKLSVEGVNQPKTFTLAQLKKLGQTTIATVLQCSGNGRGFFEHKPKGSQWMTGAAACVLWTGVPVAAIVSACGGVAKGAKFMTSTGVDAPKDLDPKKATVERSVPLKVYKEAILAWEMNGVPLPNAHGGPLRTIPPGYFGINNVKHLGKLAFTEKESDVKYMKKSYRISPIGKKGSQYPTCWEMPVKSWIVRPTDETGVVKSGKVQIAGVAMGGTKRVRSVKVSIDGGQSWKKAKFVGPYLGKYAWRQFVFEANLGSGTYNIASKAFAGTNTQPELRYENRRGYAHNGWKDHSVNVKVV